MSRCEILPSIKLVVVQSKSQVEQVEKLYEISFPIEFAECSDEYLGWSSLCWSKHEELPLAIMYVDIDRDLATICATVAHEAYHIAYKYYSHELSERNPGEEVFAYTIDGIVENALKQLEV